MFLLPAFYYWLQIQGHKKVFFYFAISTVPWLVAHALMNHEFTQSYYYFRSYALFFTVYLFIYTLAVFLKKYKRIEVIFEQLTHINFAFTVIAILLLLTPYWNLMWIDWWVSPSVGKMLRLAQLTYEPSYYSTLLVPLFLFTLFNTATHFAQRKNHLLLALLIFSLVLSFSMGVLGGLFLATALTSLYHFLFVKKGLSYKIYAFTLAEVIVVALTCLAILVFINFTFEHLLLHIEENIVKDGTSNNAINPFANRLSDVVEGKDSSGKGRTFQSFQAAYLMIQEYNTWFGVGFGQVKVVGAKAFETVFGYVPKEVALLNTLAETLANLGIVGLLVRFIAEIGLFFYTKTYSNYFRLTIFIYIFIYQFTGSFYTNIAEYVLWTFAFVNCFPQFDIKSKEKTMRTQKTP
jgi:hypothetical protein